MPTVLVKSTSSNSLNLWRQGSLIRILVKISEKFSTCLTMKRLVSFQSKTWEEWLRNWDRLSTILNSRKWSKEPIPITTDWSLKKSSIISSPRKHLLHDVCSLDFVWFVKISRILYDHMLFWAAITRIASEILLELDNLFVGVISYFNLENSWHFILSTFRITVRNLQILYSEALTFYYNSSYCLAISFIFCTSRWILT